MASVTPPRVGPADAASEDRDDVLGEAAVAGVRWIGAARVAMDVVTFAAGVALARLVSPAEFGRAAVALVVVLVAADLGVSGLGMALVRAQRFDRRDVEVSMLFALVGGGLLTLGTLAFARVLGEPLFGPEVASLLRLASPAFVLAAVGAVAQASLLRRFEFRRIGLVDVCALGVGSLVGVALALAGVDAAAVVAMYVATTATSSVLYLALAGAPVPRWHTSASRKLVRFGVPTALASGAYTVFRHVDYAILGARMSPAQVGLYWRAYTLGVDYQSRIGSVVVRIAFPMYVRTEGRSELRELASRVVRLQATAVVPVLATLAAVAPILIPVLFGDRWEPAVVPTQILAAAGLLAALASAIGPLLLAAGRPRALLAFNVGAIVVYAPLVYLAAPSGLTTVCLAVGAFHAAALATESAIAQRIVGFGGRDIARAAWPSIVCGLLLVAADLGFMWVLERADAGRLLIVTTAIPVGLVTYAAALRLLFPAVFADLRRIVRGRPAAGRALVPAEPAL